MGRSKFPGKPSKHCHRKRVNVLPPTGELSQENVGTSVVTVIGGASQEDKQEDDLPENDGESTAQTQQKTTRPLRRRLSRKISTTIRKNSHQRNFIKKLRNKTTTVVSSNNGQINRNSINSKKGHKETTTTTTTTNFGGKFVLPTRSMHSSRVIKPNKRFIDLNETLLSSIKKKHPVNNNNNSNKSLEISNKSNNTSDNLDINIINNSKDKLAFSNGHRVILRQARLKLPSQVGTQGPFSTNLHNGPGTIICGVCGAVRYYRFVKQARKFNIYSCESCRKFILKQIKRQNVGSGGGGTGGSSSSSTSVLICLNGQGNCYVPPVERTQHWKISKCAYRSRCPACWLKMCLKAFHLPLTVKQNLTQLLPKNMRGIDFSFSSSLPPILWQKKSELTAAAAAKGNNSSSKERPVRFKSVQNNKLQLVQQQQPQDIKRQKIDLKGPRVKHVCRSASIVLGQPLATFGGDSSDNNVKKINNVETSDLKIDLKDQLSVSISESSIKSTDDDILNYEENTALINETNFNKALEKMVAKKEQQRAPIFPIQNNQEFMNNNYAEPRSPPQGILLDQPQDINFDNRFKSGFSIMLSKDTSIYALCFLCGSMGDEDVLICSFCCEIYHTFCLEEFGCSTTFKKEWICMRCVPCKTCKLTDSSRSKTSCPKCLEIYHNDCFNNNKADNMNSFKLLCKECTKCSECHTATVYNMSSFPGNLPLCLNCLDIKKFGKYCPICEHSFEDSNTNLKMLECCKCKKWVHSDCEKITSEQYDILNLLSVSSTFNCSQCLMEGHYNTWYRSVQKEIHRGFKRIFRLLAKNKSAKLILLTKSNLKGTIFRQYVLTKSLDIDNNNYDNKDIDKIYSFEESDQLQTDSSNNGFFNNVNTLVDIKHRLWEYESVKKFNNDMEEALKLYDSNQIIFIYKSIFSKVFPWFNEVHEAAIDESTISDVSLFRKEYFTKYSKIPQSKTDTRKCVLCLKIGDGLSYEESRLVYCGDNNWVHANCAYWSTNVYEQIDNYLQNVIFTIGNSKNLRCIVCGQFGASIQCHLCRNFNYHFMCARKSEFYFTKVRKSCFCPKHPPETRRYILKSNGDFCVSQSLFIDQSLKEPHRSEPHAVRCLIGSLNVKNLGKIEPILSDLGDAIIPAGFLCSKLFWSTKDPWKLTTYIISTSIQNPNCTTLTVDKNFTVDHSLEPEALELAIKELNDWRRVYERKSEELDSEDDEEEKNGTQLLSPELTNTILEDLPHDILDGISVQDIFTNFSYEDMLNLDNSNTDSIVESLKKPEDDDLITDTTNMMIKEINNKSKSSDCGLFRSSNKLTPLSFTVSCKVDSSSHQPPVSKKRKISKENSNNNILLLQLDGTVDDSSSECGSPIRNQPINIWTISEEPVTCEKCNSTYRTQASYKRHLDSCELLCTSESDSENQPDHELIEESNLIQSQPLEVTIQVNNDPSSQQQQQQPMLFQAFESYQSQIHTSVLNVDSATSQQQQQIHQVQSAPTITLTEPAPISISVPLCVGSQIVQSSIEFQQQPHHHHHQPQQMALQSMSQVLMQQRSPPPRRDPTSMVIQQIHQPSTNSGFVPFTVDAFGQHHHQTSTNQNTLQYVQLAPQVQHHQPQLLQIRSDNGNVIGIIQPNIQPTTVIVQQQPQQSLVLDSSGTFGWTTTQQIQPQLYYGFETIVQNTVMQSQHFLPTPVPGVLAANSSFSTTTQVFQTSKLEPVLDVSSNSFVLVNSSQTQQQLEIPQQFSQAQPTIVTSQTPSLIYSTHPSTTQTTQKTISSSLPQLQQQQQQQNSISLPSAPSFISSDHSIPMNVVPPIQKPPTSHGRPMSRVLPMPTIAGRTASNNRKIADATKFISDVEKPAQIKLDDKFMLSKDLMKIIDNPKVGKNRKFEILDYKIIKSQPTKIFKVEEKTFSREFEPAEKNPKLLINNYEPLKEIEKVKMMPSSVFENNDLKPLLLLEEEETNNYLKLNNNIPSSSPSIMLENNNKQQQQQQRNNKNEKNYQIIIKPKSNECPPKPPKQIIDIDNNMNSSDNNSILIENSLQKLEESINKQNNIMQLTSSLSSSSSTSSMQNKYKENNITILQNERISKKFDILLAAAPKDSQLKNNLPKSSHSEVVTTTTREHLKKPAIIINNEIPEKYLDMPQLDDIIPELNSHQQPKNEIENLSMFNLHKPSISDESPTKSIINKLQIVPPLLSVKPQLKEITKTLQMMDNNNKSTTDNNDRLEPNKLPTIRKECEPTGAPTIIYTIENKEEGFKYSSASITECWTKVFDAIQSARALHNMSQLQLMMLDAKQIKSIQITNLKSSHIKYLVEQLPGITKCIKYKPLFKILPSSSSSFSLQDDFCAHGFGAVRCQPHKGGHSEPYDGFSWLSSKHRGFNSSDLQAGYSRRLNNFPIAMKFKNLKLASKQSVGVYRSKIHGKGLFCLRDIETGEMVIEYAGEVIRSILTDKREKYYNSKEIGCYMFRVDDNVVIDATMKGNAARFINHSCDPNCYSKVVEIMGHKHIIIFALRRILSGEELTYDYKFPFEEDKIPCTCGAKKCRKFLN